MSTSMITYPYPEHHDDSSADKSKGNEREVHCLEEDGNEDNSSDNYGSVKLNRQDDESVSSSSSSTRAGALCCRMSDIIPTKKQRTRSKKTSPQNQGKTPEVARAYKRLKTAEEREENATNVLQEARQDLQEAQRLYQEAQALNNPQAKESKIYEEIHVDECPVTLIKIPYLDQDMTIDTSCSFSFDVTNTSSEYVPRLKTNDDVTIDSSHSISSYGSKESAGADASHSSFITVMSPNDSEEHSILSSDISSSSRDRCHELDESAVEKKKLMRKFNLRKKEMKRVTRGFSKRYIALITSNEAHVEREAMLKLEANNILPTVNDSNCQSADITKPEVEYQATREAGFNKKCILDNIRENVLFEFFNFVPGILILFAYSVAHVSIEELMSHIFEAYTQELEEWSEDQFYFGILGIAFILLRLSGNIFEWVSDDHFACVKFDMHNRLRMRKNDARIMLWLRRHQLIQPFMNILCLYTCFISVNHLLSKNVLPALFDNAETREQLIAGLPSMKYDGVSTHIKNFFLSGESQFENKAAATWDVMDFQFGVDQCYTNTTMSSSWEYYEAFRAKLTAQDGLYLENIISVNSYYNLIGDPKAGVYTTDDAVFFFGVASVGSIIFLSRAGVGFWER
uniref:Uncharacterized protein n=1 Tax=Attheya septentrionalis TaxID=420275 RepID=A0A7S2ULB5_9STRA|mmetsp:Transcript_27824/g.50561  ORF Transcript_27824/g.50561 Transcript_27824/m.50561 type:complete len:627 (+) Transcript_27824:219-2099(+)